MSHERPMPTTCLSYFAGQRTRTLDSAPDEPFLTFEKRVGKAVIWQAWTPQLTKQDIVKWMHASQVESHHVWHSA